MTRYTVPCLGDPIEHPSATVSCVALVSSILDASGNRPIESSNVDMKLFALQVAYLKRRVYNIPMSLHSEAAGRPRSHPAT